MGSSGVGGWAEARNGHPPRWRTGGSVPVVAVDDLSTEGLPSADVRSWLRGRAHPWPGPRQRPRGMGGRCRTWCCGRTTGNTSPCELLAVVCGVVLDEALDELIDRAGLGQAALAGLLGLS